MARTYAANPTTVYEVSEGDKFNRETALVAVNCHSCGILYAIPAGLQASALKYHSGTQDGWWLCCPLGHTWGYVGKSEEQKLRERLQEERDRAGRLASELDQSRAGERAQKAAKTRIKNDRDRIKQRVAAGVCPCCNRTFQNLARHMRTKHADYAAEKPADAAGSG